MWTIPLMLIVVAFGCFSEPAVSPEEGDLLLLLHLEGLSSAVIEGSSPGRGMAALEVDVELLRDADRGAVADEVRALIDALDPSSEEISICLVGGISSPDLGAIGQRLRELPNIKAVGFETKGEAAERFREIFAEDPLFLERVDEESVLPES
jgi:hypothetical protein